MITIQFLEGEPRSPAEVMASLEDAMREREGTVTWTVLESDDLSVLYEWRLEDSPTHADQSELARLLRGNEGVHRIAFTRKGPAFEADLRGTWLEHLRGAIVVKDGERIVLAGTD